MAKTLVIVASALLSHLLNWCVVGACDAAFQYLNPDVGSSAFTVGTALLLSEYAAFPSFLGKPSKFVLYVYYILLSFFVSSLSTRLVWLPLTDSLAELNLQIAKAILLAEKSFKLGKKGLARKLASFLETKTALDRTSDLVGLCLLYWVCDSLKTASDIGRFLGNAPGLQKFFGSRLEESRSGILRSRALRKKSFQECGFVNGPESDSNARDEEEEKLRKTRRVYRFPGSRS